MMPVVAYNGILVFDRPELHGGGLVYAQDFVRFLLELGLRRCEAIFEFCAGPGYIGYALLASGFCERLTLADKVPAAVAAARRTAQYNHIEPLVNIHLSDGLNQIPNEERWDVVVGNPPPYLKPTGVPGRDVLDYDADWSLHRHFYASVKRFMKSGGHVVLLEHRSFSSVEVFEPMIRLGGGTLVRTDSRMSSPRLDPNRYYVVSRW